MSIDLGKYHKFGFGGIFTIWAPYHGFGLDLSFSLEFVTNRSFSMLRWSLGTVYDLYTQDFACIHHFRWFIRPYTRVYGRIRPYTAHCIVRLVL